MNQFERSLKAAQARQVRLYLVGIAALVLVAAAVAGILLAANATRIQIAPAEAAQTGAVRVADGFALALDGTVYGISKSPTVVVSAPGFRDARRVLRPEERGREIEVRLAPLPGRVVAAAAPGGAKTRWTIDGQFVSLGASLEREIEAGRHTIAAEHPFYRPAQETFEVGRGETREIRLDLAPVEGRLAVASDPAGAEVRIDGKPAGRTPMEIALSGGAYAVGLAAPDHAPVADDIVVSHDAPHVERRYVLAPLPATLTFALEPGGGQLLLDGRKIPADGKHSVSAREDHRVTYVLDGYRGVHRTVNLAPGETRHLRLAPDPEFGRVDIRTAPEARIIVDGTERGAGSASLSLKAVPHRIELRREGYRTVVRTLTPSAARPQVIRETLVREAVARLAEAKREYTNKAGITLVLFEPGSFVMGAPRHQRGQRANEFERPVRLEKPFYAARHEVTNAQFAKFRSGRAGAANEPAAGIEWADAAAFANWLSAAEGLAPFYRSSGGRIAGIDPKSDGYRLLSEAEWEWLARRAGKRAQTVFPWGDRASVPGGAGNIADESANGLVPNYVPNYNDGHARVAPVGSFPAEASGLFDLTGNVREWVHDWYSLIPPAPGAPARDPLGPEFGDSHVVKGSGWRSGTRTALRAAFRDGLDGARDDVGFRVGRYLYAADAPQ